MIKQLVNIQGKKYATGLFWQPVRVGVTPYLYARQLSEKGKKGKGKYALFVEYQSMIGLVDSASGARSGMPSAAAAVTSSLSGFVSFLGMFQVENYFYLVAVRNGVIIRDTLIETESEARKTYAELSNIPDWGGLFAPASWGMPRSQERFLPELIQVGVVEKLRPISMAKSISVSVVLGVIFLALLGGLLYSPVMEMFEPKKTTALNPALMAEYQRQLEEKNKQLDEQFDIVKKPEKKPFDYPYSHLRNAVDLANLCYKATGFVMQPVFGWNQRSTRCDSENVEVTFVRSFGTLNDFYAVGGELLPGGIVNQVSDNEIRVTVKLPDLPEIESLDERDQDTVLRDISSVFQQVKINARIDVVNDTVTNGEEFETIKVISVNVSSKLIPSEFMRIFEGFDGIKLVSVKWDVGTRTWEYSILMYTK